MCSRLDKEVKIPQKFRRLNFIKIVSINHVKYAGINTTSGLSLEKMKKFVKSQMKKKGLSLLDGHGHMVVIEGTSENPTIVGALRDSVSENDFILVSRNWTSSNILEAA